MIPTVAITRIAKDKSAEVGSDEAKEVIHNDNSHVLEIWEDGEITSTKGGDLYGRRSHHQRVRPFLPADQELWDTGEKEHKQRIVTDRELVDFVEDLREAMGEACNEVVDKYD